MSRKPITKTSPCNEHPLTPHFYIVKLGFTGVFFFLIFAPKHRLWVHVRTASIYVLSKIRKNFKTFHLKMNIFTAMKYCCILHGRVCVMCLQGCYSLGILDKETRCTILLGHQTAITITRLCNILQFFTAVKLIIFR